jgi:Bacteriophage replication gene A protein (GPA)
VNLSDIAPLRTIAAAVERSAKRGELVRNKAEAFAAMIDAESQAQTEDFKQRMVAPLPSRWQRDALRQWERTRKDRGETAANQWLLRLGDLAQGCRLRPDAGDDEIAHQAAKLASEAGSLLGVFKEATAARAALERFCKRQGIEPPCGKTEDGPAIARMTDESWWRRGLRKQHNRQTEDLARALGYVHIHADRCCSNETLGRRRQQNRRNRMTLERTDLVSEDGEILRLADIADASTANKAIRRAELITRLGGYQDIAIEHVHAANFLTITCPSRMHPRRSKSGDENPVYDGTTPREAHRYLQERVWERARAALARAGILFYGLRIAEPHHDGTPHWHMLFFCPREQQTHALAILKAYALREAPEEAGAQQHRFKAVEIDWQRGSAVGYVVKYVCKNIDGEGIDSHSSGVQGREGAERADAWASAAGIRQFQTFGGPAVSLWRELRRIKAGEIADDCEALKRAWQAAQKAEDRRADFGEFIRACGGIAVSRADCLLSIATESKTYQGRYGRTTARRPVGVSLTHLPERVFRSDRKAWTAIRRPKAAEPSAPWTRVNNCTHSKNQRVTSAGNCQAVAPPWWSDDIETTTSGFDADGFRIGFFRPDRGCEKRKNEMVIGAGYVLA